MSQPPPPPPPPPPATEQPAAAPSRRRRGAGRIVALIAGGLLVLLGIGLLGAGGLAVWADRTQRDAAGYVTTDSHRYDTRTYALTVEGVDFGGRGVHVLYPRSILDKLRIRVAPFAGNSPLFLGIAPASDVARYLAGVRRAAVSDFSDTTVGPTSAGGPPPGPPGDQGFWDVQSSGTGARAITWPVRTGRWSVVVMNADGSAGIDVEASVGARVPSLLWVSIGLLVAGALVLAGGALLLWLGLRGPRGAPTGPVPPPPPPAA